MRFHPAGTTKLNAPSELTTDPGLGEVMALGLDDAVVAEELALNGVWVAETSLGSAPELHALNATRPVAVTSAATPRAARRSERRRARGVMSKGPCFTMVETLATRAVSACTARGAGSAL